MTERQKTITDIIMYRNYMNEINHKYEKYDELSIEIENAEKETDTFWDGIINFIGITCILWGGLVTFYKFLMAQSPEKVTELDVKILNFVNPIEHLNIFLIVFGIVYLAVFLKRENNRVKPYKEKLVELRKERLELNEELIEHYDKYENAPLSFEFSHPGVIDIIIDTLENDEKITVNQAIEKYLKDYPD